MDACESSALKNVEKYWEKKPQEDYYESNEMDTDVYFRIHEAENRIAELHGNNPSQDFEYFSENLPEEVKAGKEIELSLFRSFVMYRLYFQEFCRETESLTLKNIAVSLYGFICEFWSWGLRDPESTEFILRQFLSEIKGGQETSEEFAINIAQQIEIEDPVFANNLVRNYVIGCITRLAKFLEEALVWVIPHQNVRFSVPLQAFRIEDDPIY